MKIAGAQINPRVGDLVSNSQKIIEFCRRAAELGADLVVFPELSLLGYPPKDLLLRKEMLIAQQQFLDEIAKTSPVPALVGACASNGHKLPFNAAWLCDREGARVVGRKLLLPNYHVFDDKRYFQIPDDDACAVFKFKGEKILLSICEDAWMSLQVDDEQHYGCDPIANAVAQHGPVDVIINMSASPFVKGKPQMRDRLFSHIAKTHRAPLVMVGQVGANDQWLFDGHSMMVDSLGNIIELAKDCEEDLLLIDTKKPKAIGPVTAKKDQQLLCEVLVMGIRDYVEKCRLPGVIIGLSGGIDSAVVTVLATRALGARHVKVAYLPSRFSSPLSYADAYQLADNLGVKMTNFLIEDNVQRLRYLLADEIAGSKNADIVDQNLQARLRGLVIMALANSNDHIMLATSNKSELAVGYSTIYGDMCGAFSPIGDLYKTEVYALADEINRQHQVIPQSILDRPPTAELKDDQLDSDSLPNYEELDRILLQYIEYGKGAKEIADITKLDRALVDKIIAMVDRAEYKRRQGPFSLMVSERVFGDARRMPIAAAFGIGKAISS